MARTSVGALVLGVVVAHFSASCGVGSSQERRYVLVDGGAHFGESYLAFQKTRLYSQFPWEVFAIEANPHLKSRLPQVPRLTVINKAMWVSDGTLEFFMRSEVSGANSLFEKALDGAPPHLGLSSMTVESFDFSQWLEDHFSRRDYIILSLDIEGAEYPILDKMFEDGTIEYVDRLYVEFHSWLLEEDWPHLRGAVLQRRVRELGIIVGEDSVEDVIGTGKWSDSSEQVPPPRAPTPRPRPVPGRIPPARPPG